MEPIEKVIVVVLIPCVIIFLAMVFVYLPANLYAEAECLRAGYPKAHVTVGLERYCSTLDGAVTIKVQPQE